MICEQFFISGMVQGVFYRDSARSQARKLGLVGWVRNLRDGRVELIACGDAELLLELGKWLKIGPDYAKVTNIEVISAELEQLPESFEIRPTI